MARFTDDQALKMMNNCFENKDYDSEDVLLDLENKPFWNAITL